MRNCVDCGRVLGSQEETYCWEHLPNHLVDVQVCPHGHVGRGIMLEAEPIKAANGDMIQRVKWECELCGEIWWENE